MLKQKKKQMHVRGNNAPSPSMCPVMKPASSTPEPTAAIAVASAWNTGMVANSAMNLQQQQQQQQQPGLQFQRRSLPSWTSVLSFPSYLQAYAFVLSGNMIAMQATPCVRP
jgi:hypothetical protein